MFTSNWRGRAALVGAVVLTAATALTACGSGSGSSSASKDGITGTIRVSAQTDQPYLQDAANQFEKLHPGVKVQLVESPSNTYQTTIRAQLDAKHAPDIMFVWGGAGNAMATQQLAKAGMLADLSDRPWVKNMGDTANGLVSYDNKVYALNTYANPTGVFYNTDMLNKLGVSIPKTFTQLLSFCKDVSSKGIVPIAMGNQTGYLNTEVPLELVNTLIYSKNKNFAADMASGKEKWTTSDLWKSSLTKAHELYLQMNDAKCFQANSTGYSDQQARQLVAQEKALGVNIISAAAQGVQQANPKIKYDMFEIPATDNPDDTILTMNTGASYAVNKDSTNVKTAIAFIDFMGEDQQLTAASNAAFGVPYKAGPNTTVMDGLKGIEPLYKADKTALWATNFWPNAEVKQVMIAQDQNLILGKTNVTDAVNAIQKAFAGS
jgi:raffinose/stachyose/melibiose transport system substrate-binding protein